MAKAGKPSACIITDENLLAATQYSLERAHERISALEHRLDIFAKITIKLEQRLMATDSWRKRYAEDDE